MVLHASDENGDWMPVRTRNEMMTGKKAVARLVEYALKLLHGEWWENPELGLRVIEMMRERRGGEDWVQGIVNYVTRYIAEVPGVVSVEDVRGAAEGRKILYECRIVTGDGSEGIGFEFG